jgi:hypothetical protein
VTIALTVSANFDIRNGILKGINQCGVVIFLVPSSGWPERRTDQLDFYCSCCFPVLDNRIRIVFVSILEHVENSRSNKNRVDPSVALAIRCWGQEKSQRRTD